jgi:hypothetical protein
LTIVFYSTFISILDFSTIGSFCHWKKFLFKQTFNLVTFVEPCWCEYLCDNVKPGALSSHKPPVDPPSSRSRSSSQPLVPCDQQVDNLYYYTMRQCNGNPESPGMWVETNTDPNNCEGYCVHFPPEPVPCNHQRHSNYWNEMIQCTENQMSPGVWVKTNTDPANCKGYCDRTGPPLPPTLPCEKQLFTPYQVEKSQCIDDPKNPGVWYETNSDPEHCEGYCYHPEKPAMG